MKYFLVVGEASGDLHASNLMKGILKADPDAEFRYAGGDLMKAVAPGLFRDYRETSFMMLDVLFNLRKIFRHIASIKQEMLRWKADVNILVDYPGVNLRLAKFAKPRGLKVFYYITPTVWAWKKGRVKILRDYTDRCFVIFPFEVDFLRDHDIEAEFHGNPLLDSIDSYSKKAMSKDAFYSEAGLDKRPLAALLAGSRKQEIKRLLPLMIQVSEQFKAYQFVIAGAPSVEEDFYKKIIGGHDITLVNNRTYDLLSHAEAGIVTSGTATLESALFNLPQVVIYKTTWMAYIIAKWLIKIGFISQVNLIFGSKLVEEVIQFDMLKRVRDELSKILTDEAYRKEMRHGYRLIREKLGEPGVSDRLGQRMVELVGLKNAD